MTLLFPAGAYRTQIIGDENDSRRLKTTPVGIERQLPKVQGGKKASKKHKGSKKASKKSAKKGTSTGTGNVYAPSDSPEPLPTDPILLSTAQNALNYNYFTAEYFSTVLPPVGPLQTVAYPPSSYGTQNLRSLVAGMLSERFEVKVNPERLYGTAGVTAALDSLMFILQNRNGVNNGVLTPTPFWPGFKWTAEQLKNNGILIPFEVSNQETMQLTVEDVKNAIEANPNARFLIICNPSNPLGVIYDKEELENIYSYVLDTYPEMHIISDEMYAHSMSPEYYDDFVSALALPSYTNGTREQRQRVHVVWGFAKDFGLNGFKVGFIHSINPEVFGAFRPRDLFHANNESLSFVMTPISSLTTYYLEGLLSATANNDGEKVWKRGMQRYARELENSYLAVKERLDEAGISYFEHTHGGQFFWIDLVGPSETVGGELEMTELLSANGVALSPGTIYDAPEEGFYRLCFTCYELDEVLQGVDIVISTVASIERCERISSCRDQTGGYNYTKEFLVEKLAESYSDFVP